MDSSFKFTGSTSITKSRLSEHRNRSENLDPNVSNFGLNFTVESRNSARKSVLGKPNSNRLDYSSTLKNEILQRRFVVAQPKKESADSSMACEDCKTVTPKSKCLCIAYDNLKASQVDFFKNRLEFDCEFDFIKERESDVVSDDEEIVQNPSIPGEGNTYGDGSLSKKIGGISELGLKRTRDKLLEDSRPSIPEPGSGIVMYLVKAFEKLLSLPKLGDSNEKVEDDNKGMSLPLPEQELAKVLEAGATSCSSLCPSDLFLTSESLGLSANQSYSSDHNRGSNSFVTSSGGQKSSPRGTKTGEILNQRHLMGKQQKTTCRKRRIELPMKPSVKEKTKPVNLVLHSTTRAVERAEFNHQVANKMNLITQHRMEKAKQKKMADEEEIRKLRKELIQKAQPMPYFDKPFIPTRSSRQPTVPKEPKFHLPQRKKAKY